MLLGKRAGPVQEPMQALLHSGPYVLISEVFLDSLNPRLIATMPISFYREEMRDVTLP